MNSTFKRNAEQSQLALYISAISLWLVPTPEDCDSCFFASPLGTIEFNDMRPRAEVVITYLNGKR
jgi:hypothetical protein